MVLIFLVALAILVRAILGEFDRRHETIQPAAGSCPACARPAEVDWLICPHCRTILREVCPGCGRHLSVFHRFCTWCGRPQREEP